MEILDLLTVDRIALSVRARDKRSLIAELARLTSAHTPGIAASAIEAALLAREQLGSTGLGAGFALPHARVEGLGRFVGQFVRLARPIDFDAIDGKPVDTVFLLLIPDDGTDYVSALAAVSRRFRDPELRTQLREAGTPAEVERILTQR